MNENDFWKLMELVDVSALDSGDERAAIEPLQNALLKKTSEELFSFEEHLALRLYAIDGEVFADNAGDSGSSDDGFLYARCYVVAKGSVYYEAVKADPTKMPKSDEQWCEELLYAHRRAWAQVNSTSASEWPFSASVSYETGSNSGLWRVQQ